MLFGWHEVKPSEAEQFLDQAVNDAIWAPIFPELQAAVGLSGNAYERLRECLKRDKAPSQQFANLGYGRATEPLTAAQIASLLNLLAEKQEGGFEIASHALKMVVSCAKEKDEHYQSELQAYCLRFIREIDWQLIEADDDLADDFLSIIKFGLLNASFSKEAIASMNTLIQYMRANTRGEASRIGRLLAPFFRCYPYEALDACYFEDGEHSCQSAVALLSIVHGEDGDSAVCSVPEAELIAWCQRSPDERSRFAAQTCQLFQTPKSEVASISNTAKQVLALACDKKAVLKIFLLRIEFYVHLELNTVIIRWGSRFLDQFNPSADAELQALIGETKTNLSTRIADEERYEHEREMTQTASFE